MAASLSGVGSRKSGSDPPLFRASVRGLWHSHVGWLFTRGHAADGERYAADLLEDRGMVRISRAFPIPPIVSSYSYGRVRLDTRCRGRSSDRPYFMVRLKADQMYERHKSCTRCAQ